jgi:hypothetical protein
MRSVADEELVSGEEDRACFSVNLLANARDAGKIRTDERIAVRCASPYYSQMTTITLRIGKEELSTSKIVRTTAPSSTLAYFVRDGEQIGIGHLETNISS